MTLFDELGLDPETVSWKDLAACKNVVKILVVEGERVVSMHEPRPGIKLEPGQTTRIFNPMFEAYEDDSDPYPVRHAVDGMCQACPVREMCLRTGKANGDSGVWGGWYLSWGSIDSTKNEHKDTSWKDMD